MGAPRKSFLLVSLLVACSQGTYSSLVALTPEPAGENCPAGGVKVASGGDLNGDGKLGSDEVAATEYICNGADGTDGTNGGNGTDGTDGVNGSNGSNGADGADGLSTLVNVSGEPAGRNCVQGGARIDAGADANRDGTLDAGEVSTTSYVCNGAPGTSGGSTALVVSAYNVDPDAEVTSTGATVPVQSASITVPGPGTIVAVGSADVFCSSASSTYQCADGWAAAYLSVSDDGAATAAAGNFTYAWLQADTTQSVTRSVSFDAPAAGTYTAYVLGAAADDAVGFWRGSLTLVYVSK